MLTLNELQLTQAMQSLCASADSLGDAFIRGCVCLGVCIILASVARGIAELLKK